MADKRFKARPTVYKGVEMRSRLEAGFAMWLDFWHWSWTYEPKCFADDTGQYLPDFRIDSLAVNIGSFEERMPAYVEVKPANFTDDMALAKRMEIIWSSEWNALLLLVQPGAMPRLHLARSDEGTATWTPMVWTYQVESKSGAEYLSLHMGLEPEYLPWPEGYWNGPGGSG